MKTRTVASLVCGLVLAGAAVLPASAATAGSSYSSGGTTTTTTAPVTPHKTATTMETTTHHSKSHAHYYVSLTGHAHACEIVTHRPSHKMMVGKHFYHTHAEAAHAMAKAKVCRA